MCHSLQGASSPPPISRQSTLDEFTLEDGGVGGWGDDGGGGNVGEGGSHALEGVGGGAVVGSPSQLEGDLFSGIENAHQEAYREIPLKSVTCLSSGGDVGGDALKRLPTSRGWGGGGGAGVEEALLPIDGGLSGGCHALGGGGGAFGGALSTGGVPLLVRELTQPPLGRSVDRLERVRAIEAELEVGLVRFRV
jgi:hypothetical protein